MRSVPSSAATLPGTTTIDPVKLPGILDSFLRRVIGEPTPSSGGVPVTPTTHAPLTSVTVASLRAMLDEHDEGRFLRSALLADLIRRDADLYGALQQRLLAMAAHPLCVDPADDSDTAKAEASALSAAWPRICPAGVAMDLWTDEALMGFALAQVSWVKPEGGGPLEQRVESVHPASVEHDTLSGRWFVQTMDAASVEVVPGDGQWLFFAPRSARAPWLWGAIRPCSEWYLSNAHAASDGRRRSETTGQGIWKASFPAGARESVDGKRYLAALRGIGRAAVIPTPKGASPETSYDVELIEAKTDAYRIFEWMKRTGGGAIRLALLGQDLTSQNNLVGTNASSETGAAVLRSIVEAQARGWSEAATQHVALPRARYLGVPPARVRLDAEPEADRKADAEAQTAAADAVAAWRELGIDVDTEAAADAARVPRKKAYA